MVIVFDGVCNLCNSWVRFLLPRDRSGVFQFAHCQSEYGGAVLDRLGEKRDDPSTVVLIDGDKVHLRSTAVLRALAALGGYWRGMILLLIIPHPLRDMVYTFIARRRYRWFGRTEYCVLPEPGWKDRFLQ